MPRITQEDSEHIELGPEDVAFGARLRDMRVAAGLTQVELARSLGLGQTQVSHVEIGKRTTTIHRALAWLRICGASLTVARPDAADPRTELLGAATGADEPSLQQLVRAVRALRALDKQRRAEEVYLLEVRAGIAKPS